ncbi:MAG: sulfotransferase [Rhodanobacteraceae bacterium]
MPHDAMPGADKGNERVPAPRQDTRAGQALFAGLIGHPPAEWLRCAQAMVLRHDLEGARVVLSAALETHPDSAQLAHALSGVLWEAKRPQAAEDLLRRLIERDPTDTASAFLLAKVLKEQGRMSAVEKVLRAWFEHAQPSIDTLIRAIELLDDCNRKQAAADICERAIATGETDPRLHAYAGMLALHLGNFERVRERFRFALDGDPRALEWQAATALASAQRYLDRTHADFELFLGSLERADLSRAARASVLFALGKAHDDIDDPTQAADYFRQANTIVNAIGNWARKNFRRTVEARLNTKPPPSSRVAAIDHADCVPIFIVGAPRSGTTLVAERLSRHPAVCNRGEMEWLPFLAGQLAGTDTSDSSAMRKAAAIYLAQLRQDDSPARWFIDKRPLNFLYLDLIAALFPTARIIHCERNARDTALSIWMQYFIGPDYGFAYDFTNIAALLRGSERLLGAAHERGMLDIHRVRYEDMVRDPDLSVDALASWLGLPPFDWSTSMEPTAAIATASAWQVRQPIYTRSVGRWRAYAACLPELRQFPDH